MSNREKFNELLISFCVCTTCICILEGVLGMMFYPDLPLNYDAFFSPPMFGLISVLLGVVNWSKQELSVKQVFFRRALHLLLIEGMVFGLNYAVGIVFPLEVCILLAAGIAVVFVMVYVILWFNDQRSAVRFNQQLKAYQETKMR